MGLTATFTLPTDMSSQTALGNTSHSGPKRRRGKRPSEESFDSPPSSPISGTPGTSGSLGRCPRGPSREGSHVMTAVYNPSGAIVVENDGTAIDNVSTSETITEAIKLIMVH